MSNKFRGPHDHNFQTIASCLGEMVDKSDSVNPQVFPKAPAKLGMDELAFIQVVLNEQVPRALYNKPGLFVNAPQTQHLRRAISARQDSRRRTLVI